MSVYTNKQMLLNFVPCLRPQIAALCLRRKIGLVQPSFDDIKPRAHPVTYHECYPTYFDQFSIKIPYAGKCLKWTVHFNSEDFTFAPDFTFYDDDFERNVDIDDVLQNIPSLANWNIRDPYSLTNLLREVLEFYNKRQIERLHKENIYERVYQEYIMLTCEGSAMNKDVEVLVTNSTVNFLIAFEVNASCLPEYLQPAPKDSEKEQALLNPGDDYCNLKVCFLKLDGSRVSTALQLSPRLEQTLGNHKVLHLPPFNKETSLNEYVIMTKDIITDAVNKKGKHHALKQEYITTLVTICQEKTVEYDTETFCRGSFIFDVDEYYCLVQIEIGPDFPQQKPQVTLSSVYCLNSKKLCQQLLSNYPYSPNWKCNEMVNRLLANLSVAVIKFKQHSH